MVLFCDVCGTRFEQGDLRPRSRFCLVCGEELSAWVKKKLDEESLVPPSPVLSEIDVQPLPRMNSKSIPATPPTETDMALDDEPTQQRRQTPISMDCDDAVVDESSIGSPLPSQTSTTESVTHDYPELSLDINTYNFPPSFPVPPHYGQPFNRRSVIMKVLGGGNQTTYPHAANGRGIYVCLRMDMNPLSPRFAGAHGIIVTRPIPQALPRDNFTLFVRGEQKDPLWFYRGQYRIRFESYLTPTQWAALPPLFRKQRTEFVLNNKKWAASELGRLGLRQDWVNVQRAIEQGDIKWEVKVIECIGFDTELYRRLEARARVGR